jgi:hypothetical protein
MIIDGHINATMAGCPFAIESILLEGNPGLCLGYLNHVVPLLIMGPCK